LTLSVANEGYSRNVSWPNLISTFLLQLVECRIPRYNRGIR